MLGVTKGVLRRIGKEIKSRPYYEALHETIRDMDSEMLKLLLVQRYIASKSICINGWVCLETSFEDEGGFEWENAPMQDLCAYLLSTSDEVYLSISQEQMSRLVYRISKGISNKKNEIYKRYSLNESIYPGRIYIHLENKMG